MILQNPAKYFPAIITSTLSDDERVAKRSFQLIYDYCEKVKLYNESEAGPTNPVNFKYINMAYWRGGEYACWSEWYMNNKETIAANAGEPEVVVRVDADRADWDRLMKSLRAGGAYDDLERPEGLAFATVKAMGKKAWPHLAKYIDDEDPLLGRAAVTILNELTGRSTKFSPARKDELKKEWDAWLEKN